MLVRGVVLVLVVLGPLLVSGPARGEDSADEVRRKELYRRCNQGDADACRQHNKMRDSLFRRCSKGDAEACRWHNAIQQGKRPGFTPMVVEPQTSFDGDTVLEPLPGEVDPETAAADARAAERRKVQELSDALVGFSVGYTVGDFDGAGLAFELDFGKSGHYMALRARADAGARRGSLDPMWSTGAELGYRAILRAGSGWAGHFVLTGGYRHRWHKELNTSAADQLYKWNVLYGRLGAGFLWGRWERLNVGLELAYAGGYGLHYNASDNPTGRNRDGAVHLGEIRFLVTF